MTNRERVMQEIDRMDDAALDIFLLIATNNGDGRFLRVDDYCCVPEVCPVKRTCGTTMEDTPCIFGRGEWLALEWDGRPIIREDADAGQ